MRNVRYGFGICFVAIAASCGTSVSDAPESDSTDIGGSSGSAGAVSEGGAAGGLLATGGNAGSGAGSSMSTSGAGGMRSDGGKGGSGGASTAGGGGSGGASMAGGGGSAGSGSGGSAGAPNVTVHACDKLGADGVWERIGPPQSMNITIGLVNAAVDPLNAGTVYAGIERGLWKSTDCGATWAHLNTGKNGPDLDSGYEWEIRVDPTNSDVYTLSAYGSGRFFRSTNGGSDWDDISPKGAGIPGFVQQFSMDPSDHRHMIVSFHANCEGAYAPMCLGETTDGAMSWHYVKGPTNGWGEGAGPSILSGKQWIYAAPFAGVFVTTDSGMSWKKPIDYPGCTMDPVHVSGTYYIACLNMPVHMSSDGNTWTEIAKSPQGSAITATNKYLYVTYQNDNSGQPIHRAALSDIKTWEAVSTPMIKNGSSAGGMPYDSAHRVLYVAAWGGGLWRVVTD